jgi:hypothetical protein
MPCDYVVDLLVEWFDSRVVEFSLPWFSVLHNLNHHRGHPSDLARLWGAVKGGRRGLAETK